MLDARSGYDSVVYATEADVEPTEATAAGVADTFGITDVAAGKTVTFYAVNTETEEMCIRDRYNIVCAARERKAQVLLYGHTHNAFTDYEDGLYLMNPGSLSGWQATYGTLDLTEQGIVTNVVTLP